MTDRDDWTSTLEDLERRRAASRAMGGAERLAKRRGRGPARRPRSGSSALLDPGSFREVGTLVGGDDPGRRDRGRLGQIDGRPVMVGAEDFTTLGGTIGAGSNSKRYRIAELALQRADAARHAARRRRPPSRRSRHGRSPTDLLDAGAVLGSVPVVTGVMGAVGRVTAR